MSIEKRFNLVTFDPQGGAGRLTLTLAEEWVIRGGLLPSCCTATVPHAEIGLLPDPPNNVRGRIEFWYSQAPGTGDPDVTLDGWYLVDIAPEVLGRSIERAPARVQVYRLCFADHRHAFVEPRGGRLLDGEVNALPPRPGVPAVANSEMIHRCLTAMNYGGVPPPAGVVPPEVDAVAPMAPVAWHGAHAPSELARLLKHCGHVYVPRNDGTGAIVRPNSGNLPIIPSDRISEVVVASSVDRRPQKVIITSAPTALTLTFGEGSDPPPTWEFVAQDHTDMKWKPLAQIPALGPDPLLTFRHGLTGVPEEWREHYERHMYRAIRLDTAQFPPRQCAILSRAFYPPAQFSGRTEEPSVKLVIALRGRDGAWVNRSAVTKIKSVVPGEGVVICEERLGAVVLAIGDATASPGTQRADLEPFFLPANAANIRVTFSVEAWDQDAGRKRFPVFGFERVGLNIVDMAEADAQAHLSGFRPDTAIYSCPELRVIESRAGTGPLTDNFAAMQAVARGYAATLLVETADAIAQVAMVKGFYPAELSGRISEVRFNQERCSTTIVVNGWYVPAGPGTGDVMSSSSGLGDATATLDRPSHQPLRGAAAAAELVRPVQLWTGEAPAGAVEPIAADPARRSGWRPIIVEVVAAISGQLGRYDARSFSGRIDATGTGAVTKASLGSQSTAVDCELLWYGDVAATSPGSLKAGDIVHGLAGPVRTSNSRVLVVASGPKLQKKTVVTNVGCTGNVITQTKEDVWVWDA